MNVDNWKPLINAAIENSYTVHICTESLDLYPEAQILKLEGEIIIIRYEYANENAQLCGAREAWIPLERIAQIERDLSYIPQYGEDIPVAEKP